MSTNINGWWLSNVKCQTGEWAPRYDWCLNTEKCMTNGRVLENSRQNLYEKYITLMRNKWNNFWNDCFQAVFPVQNNLNTWDVTKNWLWIAQYSKKKKKSNLQNKRISTDSHKETRLLKQNTWRNSPMSTWAFLFRSTSLKISCSWSSDNLSPIFCSENINYYFLSYYLWGLFAKF